MVIRKVGSLCPVCQKIISAELIEKNGKIFMRKKCSEHGSFEDLYYGDSELYNRLMKSFRTGKGVSNPLTKFHGNCTKDCGLCTHHKSSPIIGIIDVTNKCNLNCPVCFAECNSAHAFFEPTIEEISGMMDNLRNAQPPCPIVLFSGGEPTIRPDFPEICKLAHRKGFNFIIVATNGKVLADNPDYHRKLAEAYVDVIYLQFDGVTEKPYETFRGRNLFPEKLKALDNIRKSGRKYPRVVLVPTLAKDVNDREIGDIIRFAADNIDIVKGILFQPIGFVGRISDEDLLYKRITNADGIKEIERSFNGEIDKNDFFPTIWVQNFLDLLKRTNGSNNVMELSVHPACFTITYLIKYQNKLFPLNRVINLEKLNDLIVTMKKDSVTQMAIKFTKAIPKLIRLKGLKIAFQIIGLIKDIILKGSVEAVSAFHDENVLLVGFDHTQDEYNFDTEKVERCPIHYSSPDGRIIPFCSYNMFYREEIEEKFSRV